MIDEPVLDRWLSALERVLAQLGAPNQRSPYDVLDGLRAQVNRGAAAPAGVVERVRYEKHGAGFRLAAGDDEVEVDLREGRLVWDAWRVEQYALSKGLPAD